MTMHEVSGARDGRRRFAALAGVASLLLGSACSGGDVTVEQVERQVQLDPDGRVLESSASSTTFVEGDAPSTTSTPEPKAPPLTRATAADGTAAVDCGEGARKVVLADGRATTETADGATARIAMVGKARLDDFDGDGRVDLVAAYRCDGPDGPMSLSLSLWTASAARPTRSAVSLESIEPDQTVVIPQAPGGQQVGMTVLAPGQQRVRQVTAEVQSGRIALVSDDAAEQPEGVETLPIETFPDRLDLTASGLGPLRLGATEEQLTEALALAVSQAQYPPTPPCFGDVERVLQVGPIYFGITRGKLRAVWVTGPELVTTERTIPLAVDLGADAPALSVGQAIDASNPPVGLSVLGFGDDWVGLGSSTAGSGVSVAAEADAPGASGRNATGFGIAERVCLSSDFATASG